MPRAVFRYLQQHAVFLEAFDIIRFPVIVFSRDNYTQKTIESFNYPVFHLTPLSFLNTMTLPIFKLADQSFLKTCKLPLFFLLRVKGVQAGKEKIHVSFRYKYHELIISRNGM